MSNYPLITVIVPVYKVGDYLPKCIESVIKQDFRNFELLLVDDGSPDNSGEICDEYANVDDRIRVFHKENGGVSSARNLGLMHARGEWVCFLDADDYFVLDAFSTAAAKMHSGTTDIVCFNNYFTDNDGEIVSIAQVTEEAPVSVVDNINDMLLYKIHRAPWGKFYKRHLISDLRFNENIHVAEDLLFHVTVLQRNSNVNILSCVEYIYYYRIWSGSAMIKASHDYEQLNKEIGSILAANGNFNDFKSEYSIFVFLNLFLLIIRRSRGYLNKDDYKSSIQIIREAYQSKKKMQFRHKLAVSFYTLNRNLGNLYSRFFCLVKSVS